MLAIFHKLERKNIKNRIGCCLNGPDNSSERQNLVSGKFKIYYNIMIVNNIITTSKH